MASASINPPVFASVSWLRKHRSRAITSLLIATAVIVGGSIGGTALGGQLAFSNAQTAFTNAMPGLPVAAALDYASHQRYDSAKASMKTLVAGASSIGNAAPGAATPGAIQGLNSAIAAAGGVLALRPGSSVSVTTFAPESTTAGYRANLATLRKLVTAGQAQTVKTEKATARLKAGAAALSAEIMEIARSITIQNAPAGSALASAANQLRATLATIQPDGPKGSVRTDFVTVAQAKGLVKATTAYLAALNANR